MYTCIHVYMCFALDEILKYMILNTFIQFESNIIIALEIFEQNFKNNPSRKRLRETDTLNVLVHHSPSCNSGFADWSSGLLRCCSMVFLKLLYFSILDGTREDTAFPI
jgi:hypothetical protein